MSEKKASQSNVIEEQDRPNNYISSLLYSRATVFYPAAKITESMKNKHIEVAESGGTNFENPLGKIDIKSYGKNLTVNLHGDFLLQPHRDILEALLAFATTIKLSDESYRKGKTLSWDDIFITIFNGNNAKINNDSFDSKIESDAVVLSSSLYELANNLNLEPHPSNYRIIERRLNQLLSAFLLVEEKDEDDKCIDRKVVRFIQDIRFVHDPMKNKRKGTSQNKTNHIFVVLDYRLLAAIRDHGYFFRAEQRKISKYKEPSIRSFLKFMLTNNVQFLSGKKLEWLIGQYLLSILIEPSNPRRMKSSLKNNLIRYKNQILEDFDVMIKQDESNIYRIYGFKEFKR
ncbi:DNA mismatch repair protein [Vibrio metschnikovii]|uniref:DNA mismatch repair protein n=1 Tax=Vibrio metschnikovii TaxID=28172 RepID=UPI001C302594|nr:DNA mismatch repair protein [Vibrio metschnikovii]